MKHRPLQELSCQSRICTRWMPLKVWALELKVESLACKHCQSEVSYITVCDRSHKHAQHRQDWWRSVKRAHWHRSCRTKKLNSRTLDYIRNQVMWAQGSLIYCKCKIWICMYMEGHQPLLRHRISPLYDLMLFTCLVCRRKTKYTARPVFTVHPKWKYYSGLAGSMHLLVWQGSKLIPKINWCLVRRQRHNVHRKPLLNRYAEKKNVNFVRIKKI